MPRQYVRFSFPMEVVLEFSSGNREARVSDLSLGGCFVDCILDVKKGEAITFDMRLPKGIWLKLSGEIIYTMPGIGFGVRFTDLSKEHTALLEEAIEIQGGSPHAESDPNDET